MVSTNKKIIKINGDIIVLILFFLVISPFFFKGSNGRTEHIRHTEVMLDNYYQALSSFRRDTGRFPSNEEGLNSLITKPNNIKNWKGPYLNYYFIIDDPWGNKYKYVNLSNNNFLLYSFGKNKIDDSGKLDDISRRTD